MSFVVLMRAARRGVEEQREMLEAHWDYRRLTPEIRSMWLVVGK